MSNYSPDELLALLRRFAMERDRYVKFLARGAGLGRAEFDALDYTAEAGELTLQQLSDRLVLTSGATTALVDRLEAAGLLTRNPNPADRRSWLLRLTKTSDDAGARQLSPYMQDLEAAARHLSASERAAVGTFLKDAAAAATKHAVKRQARDTQTEQPPSP